MSELTLKDQPMRLGLPSDKLHLLISRININRRANGQTIFEACIRAEHTLEQTEEEPSHRELMTLRTVLDETRNAFEEQSVCIYQDDDEQCDDLMTDEETAEADAEEVLPPNMWQRADSTDYDSEEDVKSTPRPSFNIWRSVNFFSGG
jgi:hypothetical protein